jgi:D-glycero-D-manno-heptose 1,7-bisphosphate phosphatase
VVSRRAIFFDRDGVLSIPTVRGGRPYAPLTLDEFRLYPEAKKAVQIAKASGFICIVATNQPDVANGKVAQSTIDEMHLILSSRLEIDDIEVSFDESGSDAPRRKPNPGMLIGSARKWGIDLSQSFMIGDTWKDIEAAHRAGCRAALIDRRYENEPKSISSDFHARDVLDAVLWCIRQQVTQL